VVVSITVRGPSPPATSDSTKKYFINSLRQQTAGMDAYFAPAAHLIACEVWQTSDSGH
jgi:hypothetical protein